MKAVSLNTFKGCLFGGAVGDALGYSVEFLSIAQIRDTYGPRGITKMQCIGREAQISDDTQMTLFTANGILTGMTKERLTGERRAIERYIHNAYFDWYQTQRFDGRRPSSNTSWLFNVADLHCVRAPGGTCLRALASGRMGTIEHPINSSKGCGGVMRISPVALYFAPPRYDIRQADRIGANVAALTHGHPLGYISAAALTHLLSLCAYGDRPDDDALPAFVRETIAAVGEEFPNDPKAAVMQALLQSALDLSAQDGMDDLTAISSLGEGWVAEEAVAIAAYCALRHRGDFEAALLASVNHSGDSDSTGSITGSILGAYLGYDSIPTSLIDNVELFGVIREIAEDLYTDCVAGDAAHCRTEKWQRKYVRADYRL